LSEEVALEKNLEKVNAFLDFYTYENKEFAIFLRKGLLARTVNNFYSTDLISANSPTMGESTLFLNRPTNFLNY
jgi:hypothetical protein